MFLCIWLAIICSCGGITNNSIGWFLQVHLVWITVLNYMLMLLNMPIRNLTILSKTATALISELLFNLNMVMSMNCVSQRVNFVLMAPGLNSVSPPLWWGTVWRSHQRADSTTGFTVVQESKKNMRTTWRTCWRLVGSWFCPWRKRLVQVECVHYSFWW